MLRSLLERHTRHSAFRRDLPAEVGGASIFVSGSAGLKFLLKPMAAADPVLCGLAREFVREGHVVWDVGANIGLFSFAAAHLAGTHGKVVALEPDTWLVQLLRRSADIQPATSAIVQILPVAVADSCDVRTFNIAARSRALNALAGYGQPQAKLIAEQQSVVCISLDWLVERLAPPDVLKIDVEGAEIEVLRGALNMLRTHRPVLLCEVSATSSFAVTALLQRMGYKIFDGETAKHSRRELSAAPWNTVALPY